MDKGFEMSINMIVAIILVMIVVGLILYAVIGKGGGLARGILDGLTGLFT